MNLRTTLFVFLCFCATTVLLAERVEMLKAGAPCSFPITLMTIFLLSRFVMKE